MTAAVVEAVAQATLAELGRRERGETPDRRFDPLLDVLRDFADELAGWAERSLAADPLADDEIKVSVVTVVSGFEFGFRATALHVPTGLVGEAESDSETSAIAEARDALLGMLEIAGGC